MAEKPEEAEVQEVKVQRAKLTAEESLKRREAFPERKEQIVAAVRKNEADPEHSAPQSPDRNRLIATMAKDPEIQRELRLMRD